MNVSQRQNAFRAKIQEDSWITEMTHTSIAYGVSNSTKFIENGIFAFNSNFENGIPDADLLVVNCFVRLHPADEIYFSIFVKSDLKSFKAQLGAMTQENSSAKPNNNVKGYIGTDGKLYLKNKGYLDSIPKDLSAMGTQVVIDKVVFSIYPPKVRPLWSPSSHHFIKYLGDLIDMTRCTNCRLGQVMTKSALKCVACREGSLSRRSNQGLRNWAAIIPVGKFNVSMPD